MNTPSSCLRRIRNVPMNYRDTRYLAFCTQNNSPRSLAAANVSPPVAQERWNHLLNGRSSPPFFLLLFPHRSSGQPEPWEWTRDHWGLGLFLLRLRPRFSPSARTYPRDHIWRLLLGLCRNPTSTQRAHPLSPWRILEVLPSRSYHLVHSRVALFQLRRYRFPQHLKRLFSVERIIIRLIGEPDVKHARINERRSRTFTFAYSLAHRSILTGSFISSPVGIVKHEVLSAVSNCSNFSMSDEVKTTRVYLIDIWPPSPHSLANA
jgi:hypothetical protein